MKSSTILTLAGIGIGIYLFKNLAQGAAQVASSIPKPVSGMTGTGTLFPLGNCSVMGGALRGNYPDIGLGFGIKSITHAVSAPLKAAVAVVSTPIKVMAAPVIAAKTAVTGGSPKDVLRSFTAANLAPLTSAQRIAQGIAPHALTAPISRVLDKAVNPFRTKAGTVAPAPASPQGNDINGYPVGTLYTDQNGNPISAAQYYALMNAPAQQSQENGSSTVSSGGGTSSGGGDPYSSSDWTNADGSSISPSSSNDATMPEDSSTSAPPSGTQYYDTADQGAPADAQQGSGVAPWLVGAAAVGAAYFMTK